MTNIRKSINILLCFLIALLGIGCGTKKAVQGQPKKYGVPPAVKERIDAKSNAPSSQEVEGKSGDEIVVNATEKTPESRIMCKYGIPSTMYQSPDSVK